MYEPEVQLSNQAEMLNTLNLLNHSCNFVFIKLFTLKSITAGGGG